MLITGLVAQNYSIIDAATIGSYLHGYIADELKKENYIITPSELIKNIPYYMNKLLK